MNKEAFDPFKDFEPLQEDRQKKAMLYKKMTRSHKFKRLPKLSRKFVMNFLTPAIALILFCISIPVLITEPEQNGGYTQNDQKPYMEITQRNDWYIGEGENWKGAFNIKSVEALVFMNGLHETWSETGGELHFKGNSKIKELKYSLDMDSGGTAGTENFQKQPFNGVVSLGRTAGNGPIQKNKSVKLTIEWDNHKEVITLKHDQEKSTEEKYYRSKAVSPVKKFKDEKNFPPFSDFLIAGDGPFQVGSTTWEALMKNMDKFSPPITGSASTKSVLLMFKELTNKSDDLIIKGKHESEAERVLYKAPIFRNSVGGFKDYNFVVPANLSFDKQGQWTLTAYEGKKKIGTIVLDVQNEYTVENTPLFDKEAELGLVRNNLVGIKSYIEKKDGQPTIYLGQNNSQKVQWKFYGDKPEDVIIQGISLNGKASFTKILDQVYMSDHRNEYEMVDGLKLDEEGPWRITFYGNGAYLGELILNAQFMK